MELFKKFYGFNKRSLQELLFYSESAQKAINQAIIDFNPDFIIVDMLRMAQYVENSSLPKMLELQDLLSERYKRFCENTSCKDDLLGTFGELLPKFISNILNEYLKVPLLKYESKVIAKREYELSQKFEAITLVSQIEVDKLRKTTGVRHIHAIPPSVENSILNFDLVEEGKCNIIFLGNLTTNQNLSSFRYIAEKVLPLLDDKHFDYTFTAIGKFDQRAIEIAAMSNKIILQGFVDSLSKAISTKHLMLSPITFGSGIKTKILDAMSFGVPIITNSIGAEGLSVENGVHLIIEDDPKLMVLAVESLFKDKELRDRIVSRANRLVCSYYNHDLIKHQYISTIDEILYRDINKTATVV
jgi:glycosyltransferase involved in cell wall biosynthesis